MPRCVRSSRRAEKARSTRRQHISFILAKCRPVRVEVLLRLLEDPRHGDQADPGLDQAAGHQAASAKPVVAVALDGPARLVVEPKCSPRLAGTQHVEGKLLKAVESRSTADAMGRWLCTVVSRSERPDWRLASNVQAAPVKPGSGSPGTPGFIETKSGS